MTMALLAQLDFSRSHRMYLSATLIIAVLSFFVNATPTSRSGIAIPIRKPTQVRDAHGVVDVARLLRNVRYTTAKFERSFQAYEMNTHSRHPFAHNGKRSKSSTGHFPLVDHEDGNFWYGTIFVGTPAKPFTVIVDTGSSDIFLASAACDTSCNGNGHVLYDCSKSTTAYDLNAQFKIEFGNGTDFITGTISTDTVTVAGYSAMNQVIGVAKHFAGSFATANFVTDGILGLGFRSAAIFTDSPFLQSLADQHSLRSNSFGLYLSENGAELFLGGTNRNLHKGKFTYAYLTYASLWQTTFDSLYIAGEKVSGVRDTIVDSGTTLILGDSKTVEAFYNKIAGAVALDSGSGLYGIPCSYDDKIYIEIGGTNFTISPQIFNLGPISKGSLICTGGIMAVPHISYWVLGEVFLQNVYTEFDFGHERIGFANL